MAVDPAHMAASLAGEPAAGMETPDWLAKDMQASLEGANREAQGLEVDDDAPVLSPDTETPGAASGEPAASDQGNAVPSPDGEIDPELAEVMQRRQGESRSQYASRVQGFIKEREQKAAEAVTAAEQEQARARDQVAALQAQYDEANQWLGPRSGTRERVELEERASNGDWQARDQLATYKDRQKYEGVLRLAGFAQMATDLESIAKAEGMDIAEFRKGHGNQMGQAVGLIVQSAVAKAVAPKDVEIAKLKSDLANEKTAHKTLREKAQVTGLQPVTGGSPGGQGPLGEMIDGKGFVTADAIEAAMEGRYRSLDLTGS